MLLVGMMGAGKSAVARAVASELGCTALDTDEMVERGASRTVAEIFTSQGEQAFRALESEAIRQVAKMPGDLVVSVGGGAVLRAENRAALRGTGTVVWLRAGPATLAARVGSGAGRPLLQSEAGPREALARLSAERRLFYEEVADAVVDVDGLSVDEVAARVLAELRRQER